jgi:hypothetical protein
MIRAHRRRPVSGIGLGLHEQPVTNLFERLQLDASAGDLNGPAMITGLAQRAGGQIAQIDTLLA